MDAVFIGQDHRIFIRYRHRKGFFRKFLSLQISCKLSKIIKYNLYNSLLIRKNHCNEYTPVLLFIMWSYMLSRKRGDLMDTNIERWYSMKEITEHLGVSRDTVLNWIEKRSMPAAKIGRLWRFKISEVDAWMKSGKFTK